MKDKDVFSDTPVVYAAGIVMAFWMVMLVGTILKWR